MSFALYTAALLPVAVLGSGILTPDDNRMVQQDGLIRYPVIPKQGGPLFGNKPSNLTKRQVDTDSLAQRSGTLYTIEVVLGTPGQAVPVQFDTGSSELWVNPVCSKSTTPDFCNAQPRFTESSTLVDLGVQGGVTYGTGYTNFEYVADYVSIGSARITQQIFGVAYDSAHAVVGLMGAGPDLGGWDSGYPLVIDSLAEQGLTNSRAFSMDLRGFDSARGSVIFGGIDTKKYSGNLVKRPIIPAAQSPDGLTRFWVYVNGISVNQPDGNVVDIYKTPAGGKGQPVLLDSGYTLSALPPTIFEKLVAAFPSAEYVPSADLYVVDCLDPGQGGSLDFTFGDTVINVRYYDFVWHYPDTSACVIGAFPDDFPVLGDTFLRSAFVVYDWDNRMIHLAQSADCGTNLVPIGSGSDAVPSVVGACGQATSTSTSSSTDVTSTSTSTSSSTDVTSTSTFTSSSTDVTSTSTSTSSSTDVTSTSTSSSSTDETSTSTSSTSSTDETSTSTSSSSSSTSGSTFTSTLSATDTSASESSTESSTSSSSASTGSATASTTKEPDTSSSDHPSSSATGTASSNSVSTTTTQPTITKSTVTYKTTTTRTITSCGPTVTNCPLNHVTTEVITATTTVCPETTGTYTIHKTYTCSAHDADAKGCTPGATKTSTLTVTVSPLAPTERTTHVVPGCTPGAAGPSVCAQCGTGTGPTTLVAAVPTVTATAACTSCAGHKGNGTATATAKPTTGVVTAGAAARAGWAQGLGAVVIGGVLMAVMGL